MPRAGYSSGRRAAAAPPKMGGCPLIDVQGLTRHLGDHVAVADLTFSVQRGQVLGLVGPEGAGKSTILRILAGCLAPSAGRALIAGHDVSRRSREAQRRIGYLPAPVALYDEMRVQPFLETMSRLRRVTPPTRRAL